MEPKKPRVAVGHYEIGSVIGIGSFGEVRYAKHLKLDKNVALKIVDLSRFREDTAALIAKEMKILKMLDHPNIVSVYEINDKVPYRGRWCDNCACTSFVRLSNGTCANCAHSGFDHTPEELRNVMLIAQELAVGGELFGLLMQSGKFEQDVARYYFRQLIAGLEYMHSKDVIHRDLKPENLVLDENFQLKIVDFGLAALNPESNESGEDGDNDGNSLMHSGVGSQPYTAPEVYYTKELYRGSGYKGRPADVWSCGVILFVMLTGRPPFVRPLDKNYGQNLKACKHFVKIMQGDGYGNMSPSAKELLMGIFKMDSAQRLTINKIKQSSWYNGPVSSQKEIAKIMEEKSRKLWLHQDKEELYHVLQYLRRRPTELESDSSPSSFSASPSLPIPIVSSSVPHSRSLSSLSSLSPAGSLSSSLTPAPLIASSPSSASIYPPSPSRQSPPSSSSSSKAKRRRPIHDPFVDADVNFSLLSMDEDLPVYRSLPEDPFSAVSSQEKDLPEIWDIPDRKSEKNRVRKEGKRGSIVQEEAVPKDKSPEIVAKKEIDEDMLVPMASPLSSSICQSSSLSSMLQLLLKRLIHYRFAYTVDDMYDRKELVVRAVGHYKGQLVISVITITALGVSPFSRPLGEKLAVAEPFYHLNFAKVKGDALYFQSWIQRMSSSLHFRSKHR